MSAKPHSKSEEEFFVKLNSELKKKFKSTVTQEELDAAAEKMKEMHFLHCPKCGGELEQKLFKTIEIDQCKECHGVWLDPGELEEVAGEDKAGFVKSFFRTFGAE